MKKKVYHHYGVYSSEPQFAVRENATRPNPNTSTVINKRAGQSINRLVATLRKPELRYLELHLADHCNLNCKGCLHFSPIAAERYASLHRYIKDIRRLRQLFFNIKKIRLMGGEPLLHPDVSSFISVTRKAFSKAKISLVTNGTLLPRASEELFETCRKTGTVIELTIYPPFKKNIETYKKLLEDQKVAFSLHVTEKFYAIYNFQGDSDIDKAFHACKKRFNCPFLQDGFIYHCAGPALVHYFNKEFNRGISGGKGINIYSRAVTGRSIIKRLSKPIEYCRWCATKYAPFSWTLSRRMIDEWDAKTQMIAEKEQ